MLVVKRFADQKTFLSLPSGDVVELHVVECRGGFVRLGIEAPDDVLILRDDHVGERDPRDVVNEWRRGGRPPKPDAAA